MFDTLQSDRSGGFDGDPAGSPSAVSDPHPDPDLASIAALSDAALERELCSHAAHLAVAECHMALLVAEVDRRELWGAQGARTCAHWLSWRVGLSLVAARAQVRVGRALEHLPLTRRAFAAGELSYSKVRAITRIATKEIEEALVQMARFATAAQLDRIVAGFRRADPEEGLRALASRRRRYLRTFTDEDGMVVINGRLSPEDGAALLTAIEAVREAIDEDRRSERVVGDDPAGSSDASPEDEPADDPYAAKTADALVAICESVLAHGLSPATEHGPIAQVIVHADEEALCDPGAEGCSYAEGVGALSIHTVQRLCCDARVSRVAYRPDGTVVPEGRTREIPDRLRRAILARDGGCRWPGCTVRRHVQVHHVVWVSRRGKTRLTNLAALCRFHHRLVHEGGYQMTMDRHARVKVSSPEGTDLSALGRPVVPGGPDLGARHEAAGLHVDHTTMPVGGDRLDLPLALDVLFQKRDRSRGRLGWPA